MNTLKDRFDNYTKQPDDKVWKRINNTLDYKTIVRRRTVIATASTAVVAAAVLFFVLTRNNRTESIQSQPSAPVAMTTSEPQTSSDAVVSVSNEPVTNVIKTDNPIQTTKIQEVAATTTQDVQSTPETHSLTTHPFIKGSEKTAQPEKSNIVATTPNTATQTQAIANTKNSISNTPETPESTPNVQKPVKVSGTDSLAIWIPNAFSPDDPASDEVRTFKVYPNNNASILSYKIYIYSRSGRQVFHSTDINKGWDGTANGHAQPAGTYVYVIEIDDAVKGLQHTRGTITLIR